MWSGNSLGRTLVVAVSRLVKTKNASGARLHLTLTSVTNTECPDPSEPSSVRTMQTESICRYAGGAAAHVSRMGRVAAHHLPDLWKALPDRVHAARSTANRADDVGRCPTMTCTAVAVQQTVDRTPRGAFNRPF